MVYKLKGVAFQFHLFVLAAFIGHAALAPVAHAFSLGSIAIKSNFGERFDAEIDLVAQGDGKEILVSIGSPEDYQKLGLKRPGIVDELKIKGLPESQGDVKIIKVVSDRPLFYPSFNLVVRAEKDGGTLIENYLIAVDFQQSVSLGFKGEKTETGRPLASGPFLPTVEPSPPSLSPGEKTPSPAVESKSPVPQVDRDQSPALPRFAEEASPKPAPAPAIGASRDSEDKKDEDASKPVSVSAKTSRNLKPAVSEKAYGPIVRGESLLKISEKFSRRPGDMARISVAIWMANRDKFVGGNLHGIKTGETLNLDNLDAFLADLNQNAAKQIIHKQWQEWKLAPAVPVSAPISRSSPPAIRETPLPSENAPDSAEIFSMLEDWKKSWEEGDLDRHLSHFASAGAGNRHAVLKEFKTRMFERHKDVAVRVEQPAIVHVDGRWMVAFNQVFRSDKMESHGRKTVELTREGPEWKIIDERFAGKTFLQRSGSGAPPALGKSADAARPSPFVIHISAHFDLDSARRAVNQLREKGFNAYSSSSRVSESKQIHFVFVERFWDWDLAEQVTQSLRKLDMGRNAIPMRYPYAVQVGGDDSEAEALERVRSLRENGFSPYPFRAGGADFSSFKFRVLLGAYNSKGDAEELAGELSRSGVPAVAVAP